MRGVVMVFLVAVSVSSCALDAQTVTTARQATYRGDRGAIFEGALAVMKREFRMVEANAAAGTIRTSWQLEHAELSSDQRTVAPRGTQAAANESFIRFDVTIGAAEPWRVAVVGHAARWNADNALPQELHGADEPGWLAGRTDGLVVRIYQRLKPYAR
jgi:hypothetical protein